MSGVLKHFFDSVFLLAGGALTDDGSAGGGRPAATKPFGLWVRGGYDTTGAVRSVLSIVQALPWTQVAATLEVVGAVDEAGLAAAYELGGTLAAVLSA